VGSGREGRPVGHNCHLPFFFSRFMFRGTHTPSSAHGALMRAEGFLFFSLCCRLAFPFYGGHARRVYISLWDEGELINKKIFVALLVRCFFYFGICWLNGRPLRATDKRSITTNRQLVRIALNIDGHRVIGCGPLPKERRLFKMHWATPRYPMIPFASVPV